MKLSFLGTGAMVPTKQRNVSAVLLDFNGRFFLFDCGEGTQRQMNLAGYNRTRVSAVFITHWHGDHVSGLIGLIQTIGHIPNPGELVIIGPRGSKQRVHHLTQSVSFDARLKLNVVEVEAQKPQVVFEDTDFTLSAVNVEHAIDTIAFRFSERDKRRVDMEKAKSFGLSQGPLLGQLQRGRTISHGDSTITPEQVTYVQKGRSVAYVMDTSYVNEAVVLSENADVLICESTFLSSTHQDKAEEYGHLSAADAGRIAKEAAVNQLIITHFSQRYFDVSPLLSEAQNVFENTIAAYDFLELEIAVKQP